MQFVVTTIALSLLLCSCVTDRARFSEEYGLSSERLPLVAGKWCNVSQMLDDEETLWEYLTREKSPPNAVVGLEMPDERTLTATLLTDGVKTDFRTFRIKRRAPWLKLPMQHVATPCLWYVIWGWETRDIAIGIDRNGNLWVHTIYQGTLVISVVPTIIGGGGEPGWVTLFERAE